MYLCNPQIFVKFRGTSEKFERCPPVSRSSMVRFHEFGGPHKRSQLKASHAPFCQVYKREALSFQGSGWSGSTSSIELVSASPPLSLFVLPARRTSETKLEKVCNISRIIL
jgi:hypothetical protein